MYSTFKPKYFFISLAIHMVILVLIVIITQSNKIKKTFVVFGAHSRKVSKAFYKTSKSAVPFIGDAYHKTHSKKKSSGTHKQSTGDRMQQQRSPIAFNQEGLKNTHKSVAHKKAHAKKIHKKLKAKKIKHKLLAQAQHPKVSTSLIKEKAKEKIKKKKKKKLVKKKPIKKINHKIIAPPPEPEPVPEPEPEHKEEPNAPEKKQPEPTPQEEFPQPEPEKPILAQVQQEQLSTQPLESQTDINQDTSNDIFAQQEAPEFNILTETSPEYEMYRKHIQHEVGRLWHPPIGVPKGTTCKVCFTVDQEGHVEKFEIIQRSPILIYDLSVLRVAKQFEFDQCLWNKKFTIDFRQ